MNLVWNRHHAHSKKKDDITILGSVLVFLTLVSVPESSAAASFLLTSNKETGGCRHTSW